MSPTTLRIPSGRATVTSISIATMLVLSACTLDTSSNPNVQIALDAELDAAELDAVGAEDMDGAIADAAPSDTLGDLAEADLSDLERIIRPVFEPDGTGFYRMPWPSNARRYGNGMVDLSDFPNASQSVIGDYIEAIETTTDGFSTMPVIYVQWEGHFGFVPLPSAAATLADDAWVQLVDVTPGSCGERVPLDLRYQEEQRDRYGAPKLLSAVPVPGFVLTPSHTYALVILRSVGAERGLVSEVPAAFAQALEQPNSGPIAESLAPLRACLGPMGLTPDDVLLATVFDIYDPVHETRVVRAAVLDPATTPAPVISGFRLSNSGRVAGVFETYEGTFQAPIYQAGTPPYNTEGHFVFDDEGAPVLQRWEEVRFTLTVPSKGTGPFPVAVWASGTGASLFSYTFRDITHRLVAEGFAVATFQPQMHGERSGPDADPILHSFNYTNPASGRTVFRQQVIDTAYFVRLIREALVEESGPPPLDTTRLVYAGHSQGGGVGAMVAGVETAFEAYVLNGTGSYLSVTAVQRKEPIDIAELVSLLFGLQGELDIHHLLVQLAQLAADPVDPHNYAIYWLGGSGNPSGTSVFLINGGLDPTTYPRSINAITIAADAVVVQPAGWDVDPEGVWSPEPVNPPVQNNRLATDGTLRTMVSYLDSDTGHHTLADVAPVRAAAVSFLVSAEKGNATLPTF